MSLKSLSFPFYLLQTGIPSQLLLDYYFMGGAEIAIKYMQLTSADWSLDHKYHMCVEHVSSNR